MDNRASATAKVFTIISSILVLVGALLKLSGVGGINIANTVLISGIALAVSVLLSGMSLAVIELYRK